MKTDTLSVRTKRMKTKSLCEPPYNGIWCACIFAFIRCLYSKGSRMPRSECKKICLFACASGTTANERKTMLHNVHSLRKNISQMWCEENVSTKGSVRAYEHALRSLLRRNHYFMAHAVDAWNGKTEKENQILTEHGNRNMTTTIATQGLVHTKEWTKFRHCSEIWNCMWALGTYGAYKKETQSPINAMCDGGVDKLLNRTKDFYHFITDTHPAKNARV